VRRRHHQNIAIAIAEAGRGGEVRNHGAIANPFDSIDKQLGKLGNQAASHIQP
jgi:hypothetical protein